MPPPDGASAPPLDQVDTATGDTAAGDTATGDPATGVEELDGRRLRSERSRQAVVDAILELLREGDPQPSAAAIAARAGVSPRSLFRHFDDLDALNAAAVERHQAGLAPLLVVDVDRSAPLGVRVDALVAQRARLFDEVAPVRVVAERQRATSGPIAAGLERMRRRLLDQLTDVLAVELGPLAPAERTRVVARLEAVTSFGMWQHLRHEQHATDAAARDLVTGLVLGILRGPG